MDFSKSSTDMLPYFHMILRKIHLYTFVVMPKLGIYRAINIDKGGEIESFYQIKQLLAPVSMFHTTINQSIYILNKPIRIDKNHYLGYDLEL